MNISQGKSIIKVSVISILSFIFISWGSTGHYKINTAAALSFNQEMEQFVIWTTILADHASDADIRKSTDPTEAPKHYIDIDNYTEFVANGSISSNMDDLINDYSESFVYDQGILPWATLITYDSLVSCFERKDWDKAVLFASDLGHYVADGHMPMHITRNYDGQYTGNSGIHSRYESTMINAYINQINYDGYEIEVINDVDQYVFEYIYSNYVYVDSVIEADNFAKNINSSTSSSAYKQALWEYSAEFTNLLFKNASHALAEMIYTAWVEAGSPSMTEGINIINSHKQSGIINLISPNPFCNSADIHYYLVENTNVSIEIMNSTGEVITSLTKGEQKTGDHLVTIDNDMITAGLYYIVLRTKKSVSTKKLVRL